jgi:inner membrane transporter RhtA
MGLARLRRPAVPAAALVLGGVVGLEGGAVVAATVIPAAGIAGTIMLRLGFGSAGLMTLGRPSLRGLDRRAVLLVIAVGSLLAAHHLCFYLAIHKLPLGVAVTLEFAGPLTVALAGSQRRLDLLWALLADDPGRIFTWRTMLLGAVVALLSDVVSYSLQGEALGRLPAGLFSILTSTEPAVGALFGLIALGQRISLLQWVGMLAVTAASVGAASTRPPPAEVPPPG